MTCISAGEKKKGGRKNPFLPKGEARPDSSYGNLSEIIALDIFASRRRRLYHLRSRWWVSQLTSVVFKKRGGWGCGGGRVHTHTRTHTRLHVSWIPLTLNSASTSEDRAAVFYLAAAALQSYQRGNPRRTSHTFS